MAQDNATLKFRVSVTYDNGSVVHSSLTSSFSLTCSASPWTDQMTSKVAGTKTAYFDYTALHAGSDLGSFVMGVNLGSWNGSFGPDARWDFPGVQVLKSADGSTFTAIPSCAVTGPCQVTKTQSANSGNTNLSIRSMANFDGKL